MSGVQVEVPEPCELEAGVKDASPSISPSPAELDAKTLPEKYQKVYSGKAFQLSSLIPPLTWVPQYGRALRGKSTGADLEAMGLLPFSAKGDVIAGFTVGFMLVPQSLAFALLAGLPPHLGLYSSFLPLLAYALFGTIRQLQVGPTALMSLLTGAALDAANISTAERVATASMLALMVAAVSCLLSILRFGFISDFISHSVMAAFVSASGITIATSQLKAMLGISFPRTHYWWETVGEILMHIHKTDIATALLGFGLLFFLMFLRSWKNAGKEEKRRKHCFWRFLPCRSSSVAFRSLKLMADVSSILAVIIGWVWGACYRAGGIDSVKLIGETETEGFEMQLPNASLWSDLVVAAITMSLVGFVETVAVGGQLAAQYKYTYDGNQELLGLGLANAASAFMSGFPITGGFSRTAVAKLFGATSQLSTILSAMVVVFALYMLMPVVSMLPHAALAPLIIQGALSVTSFPSFVSAFKTDKIECCIMVVTFIVSMGWTVKEGLIAGVSLSIMKLLYDVTMPNMVICGQVEGDHFRDLRVFPEASISEHYIVVRIDASICFSNARGFKDFCLKAAGTSTNLKYLIVDLKAVNGIDISGIEMLESLCSLLHGRGQNLILANVKGPMAKLLSRSHLHDYLTQRSGHSCWNLQQAIDIAEGGDTKEAHQTITGLMGRVKPTINLDSLINQTCNRNQSSALYRKLGFSFSSLCEVSISAACADKRQPA
eukprot:TRINITY_DN1520_c0_g1_i2.p1 TRINITY_DN1520_c0_g1~~TRINITY_DN1520_c0_g1_i2.p1  ORF type:complete len:745 (+),score=137.70 TRINITY_DN1520_c0_g1_i2:79-2235(+)